MGDSIMMLMRSNSVLTGGVIDQAKLDAQDWNTLKDDLGAASLLNLGLGGATVADKGDYDTDYPQPDSNSGYLTNEVRWLLRLVAAGHPVPDCIMIWLGTNGAGQPSSDNYATVMAASFTD
jgi:lysophospholipase L1-like esterase